METSPYTGTIIYPGGKFICYPYDRSQNLSLSEFSDGEIWILE